MIIETDGIALTPALESYAARKIHKLDKFNHTGVHCLMKLDNRDCIVELRSGASFAQARGSDMYGVIGKAAKALDVVLTKKKAKA